MDLTKEPPRSPNVMMAGIVSLARMADKTRANEEGTLGEYDVNCPHDRPVLEFLGVDFPTFAKKLKELGYSDSALEAWAKERLAHRSPEEIAAFNAWRRSWKPEGPSIAYFEKMREAVAPGRPDVQTWFALLDIDEGRATSSVA